MARATTIDGGELRVGAHLGVDDYLWFWCAGVGEAPGLAYVGHDSLARYGFRLHRNVDSDAVLHGSVAVRRSAPRRAAVVALAGHIVGRDTSHARPNGLVGVAGVYV